MRIGRRAWIAAGAVALVMVAVLLAMGRPPLSASGTVRLWEGSIASAETSQHIADWYTPSHIVHGLIFYALARLLMRRRPLGQRFVAAVAVEAAWEIVENTPMVIDRYREATIALGYSGDSVLNSVADLGWMTLGFLAAARLPARASVALALSLELAALVAVRDNLTLNVLMLVAPDERVRAWQTGG